MHKANRRDKLERFFRKSDTYTREDRPCKIYSYHSILGDSLNQ